MCGKLLGPLLVSPSVQRVPQISSLAQPSKDVARATSFAILVKAYTFGASPSPSGGLHVGACDLSPQVGTYPLSLYSHRVFTRCICSALRFSPIRCPLGVFTYTLRCMLPAHRLIPPHTC